MYWALYTDVLTGHATNNLIEFINPLNNEVSADEIRSELSYLTETCVPYDDAYGIVYKLTLSYTHFGACGIARYLYPVQWVFQLVNPILEMFYTGNARPVDGYETGQGQHNCEDILHSHYDVVTVCCGIGSGYVILVSRAHLAANSRVTDTNCARTPTGTSTAAVTAGAYSTVNWKGTSTCFSRRVGSDI